MFVHNLRVHPAFLVEVLGLLAMHVARLDILVVMRRWTLLVAGIIVAPVAVMALVVLALTKSIVLSHAVRPVRLTLVCKMTKLASIVLLSSLRSSRFATAWTLLSWWR
jgi:hypothetical protein